MPQFPGARHVHPEKAERLSQAEVPSEYYLRQSLVLNQSETHDQTVLVHKWESSFLLLAKNKIIHLSLQRMTELEETFKIMLVNSSLQQKLRGEGSPPRTTQRNTRLLASALCSFPHPSSLSVSVWMASTKRASPGSRRSSRLALVYSGPAGSRPARTDMSATGSPMDPLHTYMGNPSGSDQSPPTRTQGQEN